MNGPDVSDKLNTLIEINREAMQWLKVMALDRVGESVASAIGEDRANHELYEALDGDTPLSEIVEGIDISKRTAYRRIDEWQKIGIVSRVDRGRYDKLASLDSLDIDRPGDTE